ncbi:hypothetical protein C8Q72DRAFT_268818 [Fomitopsis betulina]|nr:hypothetical protein C8Q72DRAFT_268818 [Fomitopsis betulina]
MTSCSRSSRRTTLTLASATSCRARAGASSSTFLARPASGRRSLRRQRASTSGGRCTSSAAICANEGAGGVDLALKKVFSIATGWKAIILIDEADVFLEQRSVNGMWRNTMVAVL